MGIDSILTIRDVPFPHSQEQKVLLAYLSNSCVAFKSIVLKP